METRHEHLEWCKQRALEYVDAGDLAGALGSFNSDMAKHPETANHIALGMGMMLVMGGHLSTKNQMSKYINDFA